MTEELARPAESEYVQERMLETLVARHQLTLADARHARAVSERTGSPLEVVLVTLHLCPPVEVYRALAHAWDAEFLEGPVAVDDTVRARTPDVDRLVAQRWVPVRRESDGTVVVATSRPPTAQRRQAVESYLGLPVRLVVATDRAVTRTIQAVYRNELLESATYGLWRDRPDQSARNVLSRGQAVVMSTLALGTVVVAVRWPVGTLTAALLAIAFGFTLSIVFKFVVCLAGAQREYDQVVSDEEVQALADHELPVYTVLVPCYREKEVVRQLVGNLGGLDYPQDKLEILLLLEEDDEETLEAALSGGLPQTITVVRLPDSLPKTKPKACNVGLQLASGEFLVIYDAEDRPEADQLKRSVAAFRKADETTICIQAALNYFNARENLLTRMFTLEYSFWFDYMLPGLDGRGLPIPLGGTSNHFRTSALRELGGWDPFNVTEDADLGIRAAARGYRVGVVNSTTFEEANRAYGNWIRQRSRWIKGYLQTVLVHSRRPLRLLRTVGPVQTAAFVLLIAGTPFSFLALLPLYAVFVASLVVPPETLAPLFPGWALWLSMLNLIVGNSLMVWVSMMGAFRRRRNWLVLWALANPLYWLLHSAAAYKGLVQLVTRPHYWEKTTHGLTDVDAATDGSRGHTPAAV